MCWESAAAFSLVCRLCAGYMRALEDAMAIIDKIAFPIDTNNRACGTAQHLPGMENAELFLLLHAQTRRC